MIGGYNGGQMAERAASELADRVEAIADVIGALLVECNQSQQVSVIAIHGTADTGIHIDGGGNGCQDATCTAFDDTMERWRQIDGCTGDATVTDDASIHETTWESCDNGTAVTFIKAKDRGHEWYTSERDDRAVTWAFFTAHRRHSQTRDKENTVIRKLAIPLILALLLVTATTALAIDGGIPDGNAHPNVGMLGFDVDGAGPTPPLGICTGSVISDRALLTAAHCIETPLVRPGWRGRSRSRAGPHRRRSSPVACSRTNTPPAAHSQFLGRRSRMRPMSWWNRSSTRKASPATPAAHTTSRSLSSRRAPSQA